MGVVSAAGSCVSESLDSMAAGTRNVAPLSLFDSPLTLPVYQARSLDAGEDVARMRSLRLLDVAVAEALAQAGLTSLAGLRAGICLGTTVACQLNDLGFYSAYKQHEQAPMESVDRYLHGNLAEALAAATGAEGPATVMVNACSSGTDAIGAALSWLSTGRCDIVIAGGADELSRIPLCGFQALGVASDEPCAPFDANRKGLNLGEGAGVVVLETADSAARRGVKSPLRVYGYGASSDAYHLTAPHPEAEGLKRSISIAMAQAKIAPTDIAFVNTHGTSTHDNDLVEGRAMRSIFGPDLKMLSTKGYTGHTLGAAGGIEAVFTAAALQSGSIPASAGFTTPDSEIGIAPVTTNTAITGRYALSTSLAFGGNNAALIIGLEDQS